MYDHSVLFNPVWKSYVFLVWPVLPLLSIKYIYVDRGRRPSECTVSNPSVLAFKLIVKKTKVRGKRLFIVTIIILSSSWWPYTVYSRPGLWAELVKTTRVYSLFLWEFQAIPKNQFNFLVDEFNCPSLIILQQSTLHTLGAVIIFYFSSSL